MAGEIPQSPNDDRNAERNIEAQSAFASTLVVDVEKSLHGKGADPSKPYINPNGISVSTLTNQAGSNAVYAAKAQLLNQALVDMKMGLYQWVLFIITSVGWFLDSFWMMSFVVVAPSASNEAQFFFSGDKPSYLFVSLAVGLTVGATAWPCMSDVLGRRWIFTSTIVLMGMGGLVGAGMPSFTGLCVIGFVVGFAVAGNQLVDAIILIESLPASHQFLVTVQGAFWGLGQLASAAVGWAFIAGYTCGTGPDAISTSQALSTHSSRAESSTHSSQSSTSCHYVSNKGWRYVWWTFGCITLFLYLCRFVFPFRETPKYLLSKRRDAEAAQLVTDMATYSKRRTWLNEISFARVNSTIDATDSRRTPRLRSLLFALQPSGLPILCLLWALTGLTFPLHKTSLTTYLAATHNISPITPTSVTTKYLYTRYLYSSLCAIPGPIAAGMLIQTKLLGRKRTGSAIALLTGLFMLLATLARSRNALLAFECILSFLQFAGLAVLTTYTVEIFAAPVRGFGVGVMGFFWGLFGLVAMIVNTFAGEVFAGGAAVWFCGAVWVVLGGAWLGLPETRGSAAA
ncbi:major facilitator superfamily domain-containing protein [Aspergillus caelatus]|uniref:Major facilitator superfamily domain-containing protein n=1 Tax=Aspergillus caelatus TaxID=61420 RepID=A0A5N7AFQ9_9EURO|nr:major facilitator superfamily domain-containing protein [Aspergillus caelatus]KAE8367909.1 major facilitator superfamily domain-containing protein [Aspergillus caelatus]